MDVSNWIARLSPIILSLVAIAAGSMGMASDMQGPFDLGNLGWVVGTCMGVGLIPACLILGGILSLLDVINPTWSPYLVLIDMMLAVPIACFAYWYCMQLGF